MPVKIRLMRIGAKGRPFYRVVAVDERKKRTGAYLDLLGTYNPLTTPKEIKLDQTKIDEWMKKGAQPSDGFLRIIGKAKQRPERPAKRQKKETVSSVGPVESVSSAEPDNTDNTEPTENVDAPVVSEESLNEAPMPESAEEAAEVISEQTQSDSDKPEDQSSSEPESSESSDDTDKSESTDSTETKSDSESSEEEKA